MEPKRLRGSNQSIDTKFATLLVDDAISFIESGRVQKGVDMLIRALSNLPDIGLDRQDMKKNGYFPEGFRGFE